MYSSVNTPMVALRSDPSLRTMDSSRVDVCDCREQERLHITYNYLFKPETKIFLCLQLFFKEATHKNANGRFRISLIIHEVSEKDIKCS